MFIKRLAVASIITLTLTGCDMETTPEAKSDPKPPIPSNEETVQIKPATPITQQEVVEAALYGKMDIVKNALEQGYKVDTRDPENRTALMFAAFNGQTELVKILLKAGADVNAQDKIGTSALMFAASAPNAVETVQVLLEAKAEINMVDNNEHFSALMWAAAEGQAENVKLLLAKGADLTLTDIDGDTAESFAAKAGHTAAAKILKEAAAKEKTAVNDNK